MPRCQLRIRVWPARIKEAVQGRGRADRGQRGIELRILMAPMFGWANVVQDAEVTRVNVPGVAVPAATLV